MPIHPPIPNRGGGPRRYMVPEDKWKVAVAQAPKLPRGSPPTSEPDGVIASTSAIPDVPASANSSGMEKPTTGESGKILDALLADFEPSSEIERGWGETLSHQAVEELNQWLQKSGDYLASLPPPYDGEPRNQNLSHQVMRVEPLLVLPFSRVRGIVRPTESTRGSRERQEMENRRRRAHSDPLSAEEGTHRLPHRQPGSLGPVAGSNPAPPATTSYRMASPVVHVPPLTEPDHPPTHRLDSHQHHRPLNRRHYHHRD